MKRKAQVLREASALRLEAFVLDELEGCIDYRTGEILSERRYEPARWHGPAAPVPATVAELESATQMERFLQEKDQRQLKRINHCKRIYDTDKGDHHLEGRAVQMDNRTYARMSQLVERIDYRNIILTTPEDLAEYLGITKTNLHKTLSKLGILIRVEGPSQGIRKGSIRVRVSPAYGFRYESQGLTAAHSSAVQHWYRELLH